MRLKSPFPLKRWPCRARLRAPSLRSVHVASHAPWHGKAIAPARATGSGRACRAVGNAFIGTCLCALGAPPVGPSGLASVPKARRAPSRLRQTRVPRRSPVGDGATLCPRRLLLPSLAARPRRNPVPPLPLATLVSRDGRGTCWRNPRGILEPPKSSRLRGLGRGRVDRGRPEKAAGQIHGSPQPTNRSS